MSNDPILEAAQRKLDAALAEAKRWEDFIAQYTEVAAEAQGFKQIVTAASRARQIVDEAIQRHGRLAETESAAKAIIAKRGRPVTTKDMLAELAARGIEIGGQDPTSTLSARLSRARSLVNERGLGWNIRSDSASRGEAADPVISGESAASVFETPNDAERRGEVGTED